ncbi:MAG: ATP-binding protein [Alphaproteobacteria bacterium]
MLKSLTTEGVGPARRFHMDLAPRLNLVTGDNGLGKTFLLDVAWWLCAHDWPDQPALPNPAFSGQTKPILTATIEQPVEEGAKIEYSFYREMNAWEAYDDFSMNIPGIILYARVDGGLSFVDKVRVYVKFAQDFRFSVPAFHLSKTEVWTGRRDDVGTTVCRGLIVDWLDWQSTRDPAFEAFSKVLNALSPPGEPIRIAEKPVRLPGPSVDRIPALEMPYGIVPITLASAAMKRIIALAYLIVWMWTEHKAAAEANGQKRQKQIILVLDEIEAHLHPRWQRSILPALLDVARHLDGEVAVQFIVSTHSPLVLASAEPVFDADKDKLFHLRPVDGKPVLDEVPWLTRGSAGTWLRSEIFGLETDRSLPAEEAIRRAEAMMEAPPAADDPEIPKLQDELAGLLPGTDPFWAQWHRFLFVLNRSRP